MNEKSYPIRTVCVKILKLNKKFFIIECVVMRWTPHEAFIHQWEWKKEKGIKNELEKLTQMLFAKCFASAAHFPNGIIFKFNPSVMPM